MIKGGPKIINDGLVLCLDAHDAKSYAGEPTTNLSPNSDYSGASLDTISAGSNGGWGTTFDRWISEIEGPGDRTVKALHIKLTGSTGSAPHAEGGAFNISNISSQYASLTSGNSYVVSAWAKVIRANGSSTAQTSSNLLYLSGAAAIGSSSLTVNTTWTRISASFSISTTGSYRLYHYFYGVSVGDILVITEPQIELKSYNTPYVYSSRSATNGWVDRTTNNNDGTLVNGVNTGVSHYRNGQVIMPVANSYLDFDGSNQYVTISSLLNQETINGSTTKTIILWLNADSYGSLMPFSTGQNGANRIYYWTQSSLNTWRIGDYVSTTDHSTLPSAGTWFCTAIVINGLSVTGYLNGVQDYTGTYTAFTTQDFAVLGRHGNLTGTTTPYYYNGKIGQVLVYNKALAAAEVLSNYNATKNRFL